MKEIATRRDIETLVNAFYAKVRQNELLGPIFNAHIPAEKWPEHLVKLADFWETNLLGVPRFKGNPSEKHVNVDRNLNHTMDQIHFGTWLQIWFQTIDELYTGELAQRAKESARKMAHGQFMGIWVRRQNL